MKKEKDPFKHMALPCPFCGKKDITWMKGCQCLSGILHAARQQDPKKVAFWMECKCGARGPCVRPLFTEELCGAYRCPTGGTWTLHAATAWEAWNIRHPRPQKAFGEEKGARVGCPFCGSGNLWQADVVGCATCNAHGPEPDPDSKGRSDMVAHGRRLWQKRAKIPAVINPGWPDLPKLERKKE